MGFFGERQRRKRAPRGGKLRGEVVRSKGSDIFEQIQRGEPVMLSDQFIRHAQLGVLDEIEVALKAAGYGHCQVDRVHNVTTYSKRDTQEEGMRKFAEEVIA